ncbi:MAG TPA: metallophosphoesterase [Verrucomicrobiae bacterium]|nr:metallophosphoesterase [Verrucomicrobiae bacterium]
MTPCARILHIFGLTLAFTVLASGGGRGAQARSAALPRIPADQPFSFVVFGDNRGADPGDPPATFFEVLDSAGKEHPAFVLDTGDMIYGHSRDEEIVRSEWRAYLRAVGRLSAPIFHAPGNHDIWDQKSARIYQELFGPTYYSFSYGNSLFIALDTETARAQIDQAQYDWLRQELRQCTHSNVFLFFHHPLFPVESGIGTSLDRYPAQRNELHQLFVRYRHIVRAVFAGHEHLYAFKERDGIAYYTSGGAGAPLYTAPELGGLHHYLAVHVNGNQAEVELRKVCAPAGQLLSPRAVKPGEILETWAQGLMWYAWDRSANVELVSNLASEGTRALRLNYDAQQCTNPAVVLALSTPWDLNNGQAFSIDVYVPEQTSGAGLGFALQGRTKNEAPRVNLNQGWNTVVTPLTAPWMLNGEKRRIEALEWNISGVRQGSGGYVVFDNFRVLRQGHGGPSTNELVESWERPLLWRTFDESVGAEISPDHGLVLHLDLSRFARPTLFARLNPPLDLTAVKALELEFDGSGQTPSDSGIGLSLRINDVSYDAPVQLLPKARARLRFALDPSWLPAEARSKVQVIAFKLSSASLFGHADLRFLRLAAVQEP